MSVSVIGKDGNGMYSYQCDQTRTLDSESLQPQATGALDSERLAGLAVTKLRCFQVVGTPDEVLIHCVGDIHQCVLSDQMHF